MYQNQRVFVVVPAYNEEIMIERVVATMPDFVDYIVVVDDASTDRTGEVVRDLMERHPRLHYIRHERNGGVGVSLKTGYLWCRENDADIAVVMNGDAQMDPADLPALLDPLVTDRADYTKGNRLVTGEAWQKIPHIRYLGNSALTFMTKIASGYWHVTDSQSGYTAMNRRALKLCDIDHLYHGYGVPNDILVSLNIVNLRVTDVPINPIYGIGEVSSLKIHKVIFTISALLMRCFMRRMTQKYIIRDFHPLVFFYFFGLLFLGLALPLTGRLFWVWGTNGYIPAINALAILFCTITGLQLILFAMLFDMEANKELKGSHYPYPR